MKKETFLSLIDKYTSGQASEAEMKLMESCMRRLGEQDTGFTADDRERLSATRQKLMDLAGQNSRKKIPVFRSRLFRYAAAAALLGAVVTTYFVSGNKKPAVPVTVAREEVKDPAINRANIR